MVDKIQSEDPDEEETVKEKRKREK